MLMLHYNTAYIALEIVYKSLLRLLHNFVFIKFVCILILMLDMLLFCIVIFDTLILQIILVNDHNYTKKKQ